MKFSEDVGDPCTVQSPCRLSILSFVQKIFVAPNFSGGTTPTFLWLFVSAIYCLPFGKVWLSSICWSPSVLPGS